MSFLDLIALAIVGYNTLRGLASGLVRTAFGLAAVTVASLLAWKQPDWARPLVGLIMRPSSIWWGPLQPMVVWAVTFALVNAVGIGLRMILDQTPLKAIDRIGGAAFGFAAGAVIVTIPLVVMTQLPLLQQVRPLQSVLRNSMVASALSPVVEALALRGADSGFGQRVQPVDRSQ